MIGAAVGVVIIVLTAVLVARGLRSRTAPFASAPEGVADDRPTADTGVDPPFTTERLEAVFDASYKVAFNVSRFHYQIGGEHAAVLEQVLQRAGEAVHRREYFPRRPMLLPRLLQALNDEESSKQRIVALVTEDPALAGNLLQAANSAFYRLTPAPVDSIDRAVVVLGAEGMRKLIAVALMQPVFKVPSGYFESFATSTWEQAQRSAAAAAAYARALGNCDPFVAQLLGLVSALARIVIFRLTMEVYREHPRVLPRAEVFIRAMQRSAPNVAALIASTWQLSDPSIRALDEQIARLSPIHMSPLGQAVYYGECCGALALIEQRGGYSAEAAQTLLIEQGAAADAVATLWKAAAVREGRR